MITPYRTRITQASTGSGNSTYNVLATNCYVQQITIVCPVPGTTWTLKIQDKDTNPFVLIPTFTLALPTNGYPNVTWGGVDAHPLPMTGGIDIVTAGGSGTREVAIWMILIQ